MICSSARSGTSKRETIAGSSTRAGVPAHHAAAASAPAPTTAAAASAGERRRPAAAGGCVSPPTSPRTNEKAATSATRWRRSFSSERLSSVSTGAGTCGGSKLQSGSLRRIAAIVSLMSSPSNARLAASISYNTHPSAHTSLRLSAPRPFACSGDMYAAVPRMTPACVMAGLVMVGDNVWPADVAAGSFVFAKPKSSTLTVPSRRTLMLAGFRSRCTIP